MKHPTVALLAILILVACGTEVSPPSDGGDGEQPAADASIEGNWILVDATVDGTALDLNDQWPVTMSIEGSEIGGRAGHRINLIIPEIRCGVQPTQLTRTVN